MNKQNNISLNRITRIYTERSPCEICEGFLSRLDDLRGSKIPVEFSFQHRDKNDETRLKNITKRLLRDAINKGF